MSKPENLPAFPRSGNECEVSEPGMTLRDYFAGQALNGVLAGAENIRPVEMSEFCYKMADAMLKARGDSND